MKKKLASNMNYELATYSCANQLIESPALTLIVGVAKRARTPSMRYSLPIIQGVWFRGLIVDGYRLRKVYHIQRYLWLSHS